MLTRFIMGIDAGGSKTAGCIQNTETLQSWRATTGPASLTTNLSLACENIKNLIHQLLAETQCNANECSLVCGVAGAGNQQNVAILKSHLNDNFQHLLITTDARTSLYGAANGEPVIVIAIGTGSVAMRLDNDNVEKQFGGWGFNAGDLGGGAYIGRCLVQYVLTKYDEDNHCYEEITLQTLSKIGTKKPDILQWLAEANATDFTSLVPIVCKYLEQEKNDSSGVAYKIMKQAAMEIDKLIQLAQTGQHYPVVLTGGLASTIYPLLDKEHQKNIIEAKGNAVDGALFLARRF